MPTKEQRDPFAAASEHVDLSVIVPVYNEAATVKQALDGLIDALQDTETIHHLEILIVESNSTDGSREIVAGYRAHPVCVVVLQESPKGKGSAVREGLDRAKGDVVVVFDADCEYDPVDIHKLLEPIMRGETSFVLGTRHSGSSMRVFEDAPATAALMNGAHWAFTWMFNTVYRTRMSDPFTMYKVFRRTAVEGVRFNADRFDFDWELVAKLTRLGCSPVEIPVTYISRHFSDGKKVRFFRDPLTWLVALFRYRVEPLKDPRVGIEEANASRAIESEARSSHD